MTKEDRLDTVADDELITPMEEASNPERIVPASELFAGHREIWIEHQGTRYRLRITRRNKLILQK